MKKIFMVEDSNELADVVSDAFSDLATVTHVARVEEALKALDESDGFDLLILDKVLPDGNGFEVLSYYKASGGRAPVIFLSGLSDVDDKLKGFSEDVYDYLEKPIDMRELRQRIRRILQ